MTDQEKLDILNNLYVTDEDCGGGEVVYVLVSYIQHNYEKLKLVVPDVDKYLSEYGDPDGTGEAIDISYAAFKYANADFYDKGKFIIVTKEQALEMYIEEQQKRIQAEQNLKLLKRNIKYIKREVLESLEYLSE